MIVYSSFSAGLEHIIANILEKHASIRTILAGAIVYEINDMRPVLKEEEGVFTKFFEELGEDADLQDMSLDSTSCKAHPNAETNQEIGMSRGGKNAKIHAIVDALGYLICIVLSAGNVHDSVAAPAYIEKVDLTGTVFMADKAYGAICSEIIFEHTLF